MGAQVIDLYSKEKEAPRERKSKETFCFFKEIFDYWTDVDAQAEVERGTWNKAQL